MRASRDSCLAISLLALLVLVGAVTAVLQARPSYPPLSSHSSAPEGARALRLWLDELNYRTINHALATFEPPAGARLILVLEPSRPLLAAELGVLEDFLEQGGSLLAAGSGYRSDDLFSRFDFDLHPLARTATATAVQAPLLSSPAPAQVQVTTNAYLASDRDDFVTHLAVPEGPVLVSFSQGEGRVFLSATAMPFTNVGLKTEGNGALALSMISAAARPGAVWFDEWHHGLRQSTVAPVGPEQWLTQTAAGRALLLAAAVLFLSLFLRGRAFGRPIPAAGPPVRRAPLEYVTAIANLERRAGHRQAVLRQYHDWLKRDLGRRYRLNPALPDEQYVAQLARYKPALESEALADLLARLGQDSVSERELVRLAGEAADWLDGRETGDGMRGA